MRPDPNERRPAGNGAAIKTPAKKSDPSLADRHAETVADALGERVPLRHGLQAVVIRDPEARAARVQTLYTPHSRSDQRARREALRNEREAGGRSA